MTVAVLGPLSPAPRTQSTNICSKSVFSGVEQQGDKRQGAWTFRAGDHCWVRLKGAAAVWLSVRLGGKVRGSHCVGPH